MDRFSHALVPTRRGCRRVSGCCCTLAEGKRRSAAVPTPDSMADHRSGRRGRQLGEAVVRSHRPLGTLLASSVSAIEILQLSEAANHAVKEITCYRVSERPKI